MQGCPGYSDNAVVFQLAAQDLSEAGEARASAAFRDPQQGNPVILWSSDVQAFRETKVRKWEVQMSNFESAKKGCVAKPSNETTVFYVDEL